jgi:hypothetical protein
VSILINPLALHEVNRLGVSQVAVLMLHRGAFVLGMLGVTNASLSASGEADGNPRGALDIRQIARRPVVRPVGTGLPGEHQPLWRVPTKHPGGR